MAATKRGRKVQTQKVLPHFVDVTHEKYTTAYLGFINPKQITQSNTDSHDIVILDGDEGEAEAFIDSVARGTEPRFCVSIAESTEAMATGGYVLLVDRFNGNVAKALPFSIHEDLECLAIKVCAFASKHSAKIDCQRFEISTPSIVGLVEQVEVFHGA